VAEHGAQAGLGRQPDILKAGGNARVADPLGRIPIDFEERSVNHSQDVADSDLVGRSGKLAAAVAPPAGEQTGRRRSLRMMAVNPFGSCWAWARDSAVAGWPRCASSRRARRA
jgi:hypothetical protein